LKMKNVIIIGAGPAGLAAASNLSNHKIDIIILEKDSKVGGLSSTVEYKGYRFDIGPHRFFTKNKLVFDWWRDILKEDFVKRPRLSRIYYNGKFFDYPISIGNVLSNLGIFNSFPICFSYLKSRLLPYSDGECFEKWAINQFGNRLYQIFFKNYTEKIWGIPCSQISADWATQRIKGLSLFAALRNALFKGKRNTIKTLITEFHYPRLGAGMMYEAAGSMISQRGVQIKLNYEVVQIRHDRNMVRELVCRNTRDGSLYEIEGTDFCSSMPLDVLVSQMNPGPSGHVLEACKRLTWRSLLMVYVILDRREVFRDNWIYVHSSEVKAGRIQNYKNWSSDMVGDSDKSSLGLEYFCAAGDSLWRQSDKAIIELAIEDLKNLKIAHQRDILDAFVLRVPNAYPVYDKNYRQTLGVIKDFLSSFSNLQCMGRGGMFRYNNMDHSVLTGFLAAGNILGAKTELWNVNTDQSYHEDLQASHVDNFS